MSRTRQARRATPVLEPDVNALVAGLLHDMAFVQASTQSRWGYKRAAASVQQLDVPLTSLVRADGTLTKIPNIGPASTRIILEALATGRSPAVDEAIEASGKAADVERRRGLRDRFLSRARVLGVLTDPALPGLDPTQYRGDLQMHSVWSDGSQTIDEICRTGLARGYRYSAVTDHSYGLPIARGVSMAAVATQHAEIDRVNVRYQGLFRLLKGIEANIRADGSLDLSRDERRPFEIVCAAPHAVLRSADLQTARMLAAVTTPGVHILGHPRGRMYGSRPGVAADWPAVFDAAARAGVAIEIDGDPARQDLDYAMAAQALEAGCLLALDSDAHGTGEWQYAETAIAHARLAGAPADRVINCWPLQRLLDWAGARTEA